MTGDIKRDYTQEDVERLRGSLKVEHSLARHGAHRLRMALEGSEPVRALGAVTGCQAVQMARAGLQAIYCSGWQVAADANHVSMYPDQSLYPADAVPNLVKRINASLARTDQIEAAERYPKGTDRDWFLPIVADAEAGFGGPLNAFELTKAMIAAGAAGVHFEDQLSSEKKCGHLGGKVLVPTKQFVRTLNAARLAADVCNVSTVIIARTDADSAKLLTSDVDPYDHKFIDFDAGRTPEGFFRVHGGVEGAIHRGLAYAPYADLLWMETSTPCLLQAQEFAEAIRDKFPNKMLAYNCSPSFNWSANLKPGQIAEFQKKLGDLGYRFQFITLAGFHSLNSGMYELAQGYKETHMTAYADLQDYEFDQADFGYTAVKHQREVGTGYFDLVSKAVSGGESSTTAMEESTESEQF